jgi:pyruvate/2-oxoglutarate dehydrogenase complex dihydrolipoamide acyltransferase (E2) component
VLVRNQIGVNFLATVFICTIVTDAIKASGPKNNLLKSDVLTFLKNPSANSASIKSAKNVAAAADKSTKQMPMDAARARRRPRLDTSQRPHDIITPSQTRSIIAKRLTNSKCLFLF